MNVKIAIVASLLLAGCYSAPVPLGPLNQALFDATLLGTWQQVDASGDEPDRVVVRTTAGAEYEIEVFSIHPFSQQRIHGRLRGYIVHVDGVPFLNARVVASTDSGESDWMFFRYEVSGDGMLTVRAVKEDAFDGRREPADLYEFLRHNLRRDDLYTDVTRYRNVDQR